MARGAGVFGAIGAAGSDCHQAYGQISAQLLSTGLAGPQLQRLGLIDHVSPYYCSLFDPLSNFRALIPTKDLPHSIIKASIDGSKIISIPKNGSTADLINISTQFIIHAAKPILNHLFYGHGALSADGSTIFITEQNPATASGKISVRDAKDLRILDIWDTYGNEPHQLKVAADGKSLFVSNAGYRALESRRGDEGATNVACLDSSSGRLIGKFETACKDVRITHFDLFGTDRIVVAGVPMFGHKADSGRILMSNKHQNLVPVEFPQDIARKLVNDSFSTCVIPGHEQIAVTYPFAGYVAFVGFDGIFIDALPLRGATGVAAGSSDHCIYINLAQSWLIEIDVRNYSIANSSTLSPMAWVGGGHLNRII